MCYSVSERTIIIFVGLGMAHFWVSSKKTMDTLFNNIDWAGRFVISLRDMSTAEIIDVQLRR